MDVSNLIFRNLGDEGGYGNGGSLVYLWSGIWDGDVHVLSCLRVLIDVKEEF